MWEIGVDSHILQADPSYGPHIKLVSYSIGNSVGNRLGFVYTASGLLVRSSYKACE